MHSNAYPMPYKVGLFLLILISFIGTSNAQSISNKIDFKFNYKPIVSDQFINSNTKEKPSVSKKIIQDSQDHSHKASKQKKQAGSIVASSLGNDSPSLFDIIIPPDTLLNNFHFDQQQLNVPIGATVNWDNHDSTDHNLQVFRIVPGLLHYEPYGSKDLSPFDTLTVQFKQPGEYAFQCISPNHNNMTGTIFVS
jgi:plastocyanin